MVEVTKIVIIILLILLTIMFSGILSVVNENSKINVEYSKVDFQLKRNIEFSNITSSRLENLRSDYDILESDYDNLLNKTNQISNLLTDIEEELTDFERKINNSLEWIKANNNLGKTNLTRVMQDLKKECVNVRLDSCQINAHCINYVNFFDEFEHQLKYFKEEGDVLLSIEEMYDEGGGDCEDWSLLFKAEYNYLKDFCYEKNFSDEEIVLIYGESSDDEDDMCGLFKTKALWYLPYCKRSYLNNKTNPSIICYEKDVNAHCIVAFTENEIENESMIYSELVNAVFIEPQSGLLNEDNFTVFDRVSLNDSYPTNHIYNVLTDDDFNLFTFYEDDYEWFSYSYFYDKAVANHNELELIIGSVD